ncbi:hypothetical protein FXW07_16575 [Methanosarcina sp. DH1]|uniref:hypothetical protein n=1 Tax=Methanosarcina sp. DH1 TaxID=2605695 RepID=UPI001E60024F|nr:hypothetical protein [Methanosarcina sp. DH1]MCC4768168.1 hypothetical protein [Methanosarcina sp. DH1]
MPNTDRVRSTQQRNRKPEAADRKSAALFRWTVMLCFLVAYYINGVWQIPERSP